MRDVTWAAPTSDPSESFELAPETSCEWIQETLDKLPDMLTPAQVADFLRISARSARELCAAGALPGSFKLGSSWRIPKLALRSLMGTRGVHGNSIRNMGHPKRGD